MVFISLMVVATRVFAYDDTDLSSGDNSSTASADAVEKAVDMSMLGWGVGLSALIALLAILTQPDGDSTSHAHNE